jgi:hypothetical protein
MLHGCLTRDHKEHTVPDDICELRPGRSFLSLFNMAGSSGVGSSLLEVAKLKRGKIARASMWMYAPRSIWFKCSQRHVPNAVPAHLENAVPDGVLEAQSWLYRNRQTIGQLTMNPVDPNLAPPGPVMKPFSARPRIWNSSLTRDR